jgi:hypothetical protein
VSAGPAGASLGQLPADVAGARVLRSGRKVGIAGFLLTVGVACTQLFGGERQNTLAPLQGSGGTTPSATAPLQPGAPAGVCAAGQMRCEGALLQTCSDDLSTWVTVQRCGAAALCQADPASCLPATCAPEEMSCSAAVLQKCNAERTGWDVFNTCLSPAHCNSSLRQCLTDACNPGDRRCDRSQTDQSPVLEVCRADRSGWDRLDSCVTRELCDQTLTSTGLGGLALGSDGMVQVQAPSDPSTVVQCNLPSCAVGETRCEGARLQFCSEGRTGWITAEECASEALCQSSIGVLGTSGTPQCLPPACAAGQHRCSETGMLQVCSEDRSNFVDQEQCVGAPFCNAVLADQGQSGCTDAPCEAGLAQCNGAQIQLCRDDRTGLDPVGEPCESAALCNADDPANAFCEEPLCRRGATSGDEFRCEGAQLQRCNESLTVYDTLQTCVTAALCDASQRFDGCRPPVCDPGEFACADGFLQVCNTDRTGFDSLENCGSQAQCDANAGRCADPCEPGSTRCNAGNGDLERCNDRLTGWQPIADCPNVRLCDAENERCLICVPGEFSCADGQLRQCAADGRTFARQNIPPECALDPATNGGGIRSCSQNNQVVINPCPLGCSQNRCHECFEGQTQCVGNGQIRACVNGFFGAPSNCSDNNFCNGTETCANNRCVGGAPPGCNGFGCQLNRCNNCSGGACANGTQFQTCDNGLLSTARNCPAGQVCQGGGNCLFNCAALNCNDGNPCSNDTCSAQNGCASSNVNNGTSCSDGNACNGSETCQNGSCNRGGAPNCNDGNPCTSDTCNPGSGCSNPPVANGTSCADANACNGNETCQNGFCNNPADVVCAAPPACRTVSCNAATGACTPGNAPNGSACTTGGAPGTCSGGTCVATNPCATTTCNQNVVCAGAVTCIPQGGVAQCIPIASGPGTACRTATGAAGTCNGTGTGTAACIATPVAVCSAGERRCTGTTVEICNATRTGFVTDTNACVDADTRISCTSGTPTPFNCPGALCREPFCSAGVCTTRADNGSSCVLAPISNGLCDAAGTCRPTCQIQPCASGSFCTASGNCNFLQ